MHEQLTKIVQIDPHNPETTIIEHAAGLIQKGQLVVFPTETVYGLGGNALQPQAVEGIFAAKGRPFSDPLIIHIAERRTLETLTTEVSPRAHKLMENFWPGPLTLILPAGPRVPRLITAGLPTVAIRMPSHPIALALIRAAGSPIAAPSANRFMHVSPTTAQHVLADLNGRVPLILDGGPCEVGIESTVLDLCSTRPTILRPGGISLETLRTILPEVQPPQPRPPIDHPGHQEESPQISPGQMLTHYSPTVPTFLFEGEVERMREAMLNEVQRRQAQGERVGVLIADEDLRAFQGSGAQVYALGDSLDQIAKHLFIGLRKLEEAGVHIILCRSFAAQGVGLAIGDRLRKAAGGKILQVGPALR
jgi:L-threonylcarbamoyladenylate synthase